MTENTLVNWTKYAAILTVFTLVLGAVYWTFGVWMTATEAKQLATENKQILKETLQEKADKSDIQDLKEEIRRLTKKIDDLQEDLNNSAFIKHSKHRPQEDNNN